jgi:hypothetical protein
MVIPFERLQILYRLPYICLCKRGRQARKIEFVTLPSITNVSEGPEMLLWTANCCGFTDAIELNRCASVVGGLAPSFQARLCSTRSDSWESAKPQQEPDAHNRATIGIIVVCWASLSADDAEGAQDRGQVLLHDRRWQDRFEDILTRLFRSTRMARKPGAFVYVLGRRFVCGIWRS